MNLSYPAVFHKFYFFHKVLVSFRKLTKTPSGNSPKVSFRTAIKFSIKIDEINIFKNIETKNKPILQSFKNKL